MTFKGENTNGSPNIFTDEPFTVEFTQPEGVTADCNFDGTVVTCTPKNEMSVSDLRNSGISFSQQIQYENSKRKDGTNTKSSVTGDQTLIIKTESEPVKLDSEGKESILREKNKSSGLSGGAIAGIIIACAAVLVGAILTALLCRKTTTSTSLYTTGTQDNLAIEQKPVYY